MWSISNFHHNIKCFVIRGGGFIVILFIGQVHNWQALFGLTLICLRTGILNDKPLELEGIRHIGHWRILCFFLMWNDHFIDSCDVYICVLPAHLLNCKTWLQRPQGIEIPAIWFASTWFIIFARLPPIPHTLQILALPTYLLLGLRIHCTSSLISLVGLDFPYQCCWLCGL